MVKALSHYRTLFVLVLGIGAVFIGRTFLAAGYPVPRLSEIFETVTVLGSIAVCIMGYGDLRKSDCIIAILLGIGIGAGMCFATLFTPYPVWGVVKSNTAHAIYRSIFIVLVTMGGLVIMRQGGPVQFSIANQAWRQSGKNMAFGLFIGLPLAVLNIYVLQRTVGRAVSWQNLLAAVLDAMQPGVFEEVVYRFAFIGLLWFVLRKSFPKAATWIAGALALFVHNFMHFDDLFLQSPLAALGMGTVMAVLWGLPPTILVLRKDLESAVAFHWIQDAARFLAGF